MKKIFQFIYTEIAYNGHMQTLGSLFKLIFAAQLFAIKITWDFAIIIYLSLYLIYIYNRFKEIEIDQLTNITRTEHLKKFDKHIPLIIFLIIIRKSPGVSPWDEEHPLTGKLFLQINNLALLGYRVA